MRLGGIVVVASNAGGAWTVGCSPLHIMLFEGMSKPEWML